MDNRALASFDPASRNFIGDKNSPKVLNAVALIRKARENVQAASDGMQKEHDIDLEPFYSTPTQDLRDAVGAINEIMDEKTKQDTERVGLIMMSGYVRQRLDVMFKKPKETGTRASFTFSMKRENPQVQSKINTCFQDFLLGSEKLLQYIE